MVVFIILFIFSGFGKIGFITSFLLLNLSFLLLTWISFWLPNTDLISKLVIDKIKSKINIDENYNINNSGKKCKPKKKEIIIKPKEEEKKEFKIEILDINQNIKNEELDDMIRIPHKINLAEYEVSQTSSYLSESLQNNNFNFNNNNNNQININKIKMNIFNFYLKINEWKYIEIILK